MPERDDDAIREAALPSYGTTVADAYLKCRGG
jgi:hypothetical protein